MSYILDALKKSEEQRGALNVSATPPVMSPINEHTDRRFIWPVILIIAALLAGWLFAQWQKPDRIDSIDDQVLHVSPVVELSRVFSVPVERELKKNRPDTVDVEQPVSVLQPDHMEITAAPDRFKEPVKKMALFTPMTPASVVTEQGVSHQVPGNGQGLVTNAVVPSLNELTMQEQRSIPAIKIEGHIYDVEPAARMVIINGKVRKEKHTIASGLLLQEITPDGVIMNYQGRIFHMGIFDR